MQQKLLCTDDKRKELWEICEAAIKHKNLDETYLSRLEREMELLTDGDAFILLFAHKCMKEAGLRPYDANIRGTFANLLIAYLLEISEIDPLAIGVSYMLFLGRNDRKVISINIPMRFAESIIESAKRLLTNGWGAYFNEVNLENSIWACESVTNGNGVYFHRFKILDELQMKLDKKGITVQNIPVDDQTITQFFDFEKTKKTHPYPFNTDFSASVLEELDFSIHSLKDFAKIMGLLHGSGIWFDNMKPLLYWKDITLSEAIASRDDILSILTNAGYDEESAFRLSYWIYTGKKNESSEWKSEATKVKGRIPRWQYDSFEMIKYLFPYIHSLSYALTAWRLMWLSSEEGN